jgi:signal transduction protein with GAF and PtsI domain
MYQGRLKLQVRHEDIQRRLVEGLSKADKPKLPIGQGLVNSISTPLPTPISISDQILHPLLHYLPQLSLVD